MSKEVLPCAEDDDGRAREAFKDCLEAYIEEEINCTLPWRSHDAVNQYCGSLSSNIPCMH